MVVWKKKKNINYPFLKIYAINLKRKWNKIEKLKRRTADWNIYKLNLEKKY